MAPALCSNGPDRTGPMFQRAGWGPAYNRPNVPAGRPDQGAAAYGRAVFMRIKNGLTVSRVGSQRRSGGAACWRTAGRGQPARGSRNRASGQPGGGCRLLLLAAGADREEKPETKNRPRRNNRKRKTRVPADSRWLSAGQVRQPPVKGVRSKACGQRRAVKGVRSKACGQRRAVKGVRSKACGQRRAG
jgi:hypothetical protein